MYQIGWGKQAIAVQARGYAMHGYGVWTMRATCAQTPLYARAICLQDAGPDAEAASGQSALIFCCLDLGYVTYAMRAAVSERLQAVMGTCFNDAALILTCTHTHSGPGGCSHDALYNLVTPGFVSEHLEQIVAASVTAIVQAWQSALPTELGLTQGRFDDATPVAWNRALRAYNRNPEVERRKDTETHLALDRAMQVLSMRRDGKLQSLLSLFGVHATCLGNSLTRYDGDNKGYAAAQAEQALASAGIAAPVAIFAQATAGDVSPHFHGRQQLKRRQAIQGAAEYAYAKRNGEYQSELALALLAGDGETVITGRIDSVLTYVDFTDITADPAYSQGETQACTSEPCHGVPFFEGTPVDGLGMPKALALLARGVAYQVKRYRQKHMNTYPPEERAYFQRLYAAQGPKAILMESGRKRILGQSLGELALPGFVDPMIKEMKRQVRVGALTESALVPTVLPLQIVTIGTLALVCCPGEFTTVAGERLRQVVAQKLQASGIKQVLMCTYCNDYMGYVTTREEYLEQTYEGGHTIFGQWTLAAFQTRFAALADELLKPPGERTHDRLTRPAPAPAHELALRSDLPIPAH